MNQIFSKILLKETLNQNKKLISQKNCTQYNNTTVSQHLWVNIYFQQVVPPTVN